MSRRDPADLARCAAAVRVASGPALIAATRQLGRLLIGAHAETPGARLFIAAFGARDALLGGRDLKVLQTEQPARTWIAACAAADAFDTAATVQELRPAPATPSRPDAIGFALPAALGRWLAIKLIDPAPSVSASAAGSPRPDAAASR